MNWFVNDVYTDVFSHIHWNAVPKSSAIIITLVAIAIIISCTSISGAFPLTGLNNLYVLLPIEASLLTIFVGATVKRYSRLKSLDKGYAQTLDRISSQSNQHFTPEALFELIKPHFLLYKSKDYLFISRAKPSVYV